MHTDKINKALIEKMKQIVPPDISDQQMECGGREALDARLSSNDGERKPLDCNGCEINKICLIGLAKAS